MEFEFPSGRKIQSALFATFSEICSILNDSNNSFVKEELKNEPQWNNFSQYFIIPIKTRFTEGLLSHSLARTDIIQDSIFSGAPLDQGVFSYNSIQYNEEKSHKDDDFIKLPLMEFVQSLSNDFKLGKRSNSIKKELEEVKKEEMEFINDDNEDQYNLINDGLHPSLMHYGSDRLSSECGDFYDNNYWSTNLVVDEVNLSELTK